MKIAIVLEFDDSHNTDDVYLWIDSLLDAGAIQDCIKEHAADNDGEAEIVDAFCAPFNASLLSEMDE